MTTEATYDVVTNSCVDRRVRKKWSVADSLVQPSRYDATNKDILTTIMKTTTFCVRVVALCCRMAWSHASLYDVVLDRGVL